MQASKRGPAGAPARARSRALRPQRAGRPPSGKQHRPVKKGNWHPVTSLKRVWRSQPLSTRLALITTGLLTFGLLIVSLAVTSLLYTQLVGQVDDQLRVTATTVGKQGLDQARAQDQAQMPSTYFIRAEYPDQPPANIVSQDTLDKYGHPAIPSMPLSEAVAQSSDPQLITVDSNLPGHQWRVIYLPIENAQTKEHTGVIAIALPLSTVMETLKRTQLVVALSDVAVILLGAIAAAYLVHRAFRSLRQIEAVAGRIAKGDLSARVHLTEPQTTEVGSVQRALNTMLQQNEQAFTGQVVAQERMTRFVSDASHELRTPLAAIRGYGELYRMGGVPPERHSEVMGRIESEASRMGRLVDDLLQLARMDEGRELTMERVDLTAIARGALTDMMVLAPERDCALIRLDGDLDADPGPAVVIGDRDRLSQVVTNLLGNVTRHTPAGSSVEIAVGTRSRPDWDAAVVEVRDHGPGVPADQAAKVFERFYRSDSSRHRETGGSGLGLAIVSAIIARHDGTVQMLPTPGGGATVRLEVPLAPGQRADDDRSAPVAAASAPG